MSDASRLAFAETVTARCRLQFGLLWNVRIVFPPPVETAVMLKNRFSDPPADWDSFDKVFVADFFGTQNLNLVEFDVKTRHVGHEEKYAIENPAKTIDILGDALAMQFSPVAKMEKSSSDNVTLRLRGADLASLTLSDDSRELQELAGISLQRSVLLPFVRSMDRNGKLIAVAPVSWTVLAPEKFEAVSNLLRCRVESSLRYSMSSRKRGQTEVYALSVPTPMRPTLLKLQARLAVPRDAASKDSAPETVSASFQTLPVYDVFEAIPGDKKLHSVGQTNTDGSFLLEPLENRPVRTVLIRSGRTLIAQIPIVRGLQDECPVPIPDDSVRLEAEAVVLGIQEEMIDVAARRSILEQRLKRFEKENDKKNYREIESDINRLKDADRFLLELDQARLRFRSNDPVVQRRIDKMFRDTRRAIRGR